MLPKRQFHSQKYWKSHALYRSSMWQITGSLKIGHPVQKFRAFFRYSFCGKACLGTVVCIFVEGKGTDDRLQRHYMKSNSRSIHVMRREARCRAAKIITVAVQRGNGDEKFLVWYEMEMSVFCVTLRRSPHPRVTVEKDRVAYRSFKAWCILTRS
jgi:hypothetical protein